jgi:hypothetical protein
VSAPHRYAEGTSVPVSRSQGEIAGILAEHGVQRQGWMSGPEGDELNFELRGHLFRFTILRPTASLMRQRDGGDYSYPDNIDWQRKAEQEWRRRWRANVLLLKAKLEFIDSGDTTLERELLPYMLTAGGQTVGELLVAGKIPLLEAKAS